MIKTYRNCATLGVCQGDGRCADCDFKPALQPWPKSYPFAPGVIDGLPNADARSLRYRIECWLHRAAFLAALVALAGFAAGYLSGCTAL